MKCFIQHDVKIFYTTWNLENFSHLSFTTDCSPKFVLKMII